MAALNEIPLSGVPETFSIDLGSQSYQLTVRWNVKASYWVLDIAKSGGAMLVAGIPLVTGHNLLEQYAHLGLDFILVVSNDSDPDQIPPYEGLGTTSHLYYQAAP